MLCFSTHTSTRFQKLTAPCTDLQDHRAASILRFCPTNRDGVGAELENSMSIVRSGDGHCDVRRNSQAGCTKDVTDDPVLIYMYMYAVYDELKYIREKKNKKQNREIENMIVDYDCKYTLLKIDNETNCGLKSSVRCSGFVLVGLVVSFMSSTKHQRL